MGGFNSGRKPYSSRARVEQCLSIAANQLHKAGYLDPGWIGSLEWSIHGEPVATIYLLAEESRLRLFYSRCNGGAYEDVTETIDIVRNPCYLGGTRPFFKCPGCTRRVLKLYSGGSGFRCRHCYGLAYASQAELQWERALRRARKAKSRLGDLLGLPALLLQKPRHMQQRKFECLQLRALNAEIAADRAFTHRIEKLVSWIEKDEKQSAKRQRMTGSR